MSVSIRPMQAEDADGFWRLAFSDPTAEWTRWNAPYFNDPLPTKAAFLETVAEDWLTNPDRNLITADGKIVGVVTAFFEDDALERWLECGIVVYDPSLWGQHIGRQAMTLWLTALFARYNLPHIGFTTWSGNERMMALGESLGMTLEARIRQVRYWDNRYWDSIKYGILRTEWEARAN